jgi:hypothetical protein
VLVVCLLTSAVLAQVNPRTSWDLYHDAHLIEAVDGDLPGAATTYQQLVRDLLPRQTKLGTAEARVPTHFRGDVYYALGHARYRLGDVTRAREALLEGIRTNTCPDLCNAFLSQLELEQNAVRDLPIQWGFDSPDHGFFHPWINARDKGSIRIHKEHQSDNPALVWDTVIDNQPGDMLVVAFQRPKPTPSTIRLKMQSASVAAQVDFVIVDEWGHTYRPKSGTLPVPALDIVNVNITLTELVAIERNTPPFNPARISRFEIHDVSAFAMATPGTNALYLDDFEVR